jgi:SulP family sulfate permease
MVEKKEFVTLLRGWPSMAVLLSTFGLTIFRDLTTGIIAGCALAALLSFFHRGVAEEGA